jgi:hypothetical protein
MEAKVCQAPKKVPVDLEESEVRVIKELRKVTNYGFGRLEVIVQNNGEISMIHTTTNTLLERRKRN